MVVTQRNLKGPRTFALPLVRLLQVGDLSRKKCVSGKFVMQAGKQLHSLRIILLPYICNGQQDSRKGRQVVPALSGHLQVGNSTLLVRGQPADAEYPTHRRCHAADDVLAETR